MKPFWGTFLSLWILVVCVNAQSSSFTYQGSLKDGVTAASGNYDFEFRLYDAASAGNQIGSPVARNGVGVESGSFSVLLDFGAASFIGADRWIEVWVRPGGGGGFQQLLPRAKLASAPYAIQSLNATNAINATNATNAATATNATQLGGVPANQYVTAASGSANYIQNTTSPQAASNFNISGTGTANVFNAATQFNIGGNRVLSVTGTDLSPNFFAGPFAGASNTTGGGNSFFGRAAGSQNTAGNDNSFFGRVAGINNLDGGGNAFFGRSAGQSNSSGSSNTFLGMASGADNSTGSNNTTVGYEADTATGNLSFATAIGSSSIVSNSNSVVLGRPGGEDTVRIPGALNITGNMVQATGALAVFNSPVRFVSLSSGGATALCRNASDFISTCSSSLRYKTNISRFGFGLNLIKQLKPITFDWKEGGMHDLGLGAEDVAAIEPLLVTYNTKGEVEGVKYDRIGVVLVNAVKEQQAQIESQKAEIELLKKKVALIDEIKKLLCLGTPSASVCMEVK